MLKRLKTSLPLIAIAGISALSLGMVAALVNVPRPDEAMPPEAEGTFPGFSRSAQLSADDPVLKFSSNALPTSAKEQLQQFV